MSNNAVKLVVQNEQQLAAAKEMEALQKRMAELKKTNKAIKIELVKFTKKGETEEKVGINVHGISHKPIFLYGSQALAFVAVAEQLRGFVEENRAALTWKKE